MEIKVISGHRNANMKKALQKLNIDNCIEYPEVEIIHNYDLSEKIMKLCDDFYNIKKTDLIIITYSEIVVNSIRLWSIRTGHADLFVMITVMDDGKIKKTKMDESGELLEWENGVFDVQQVILSEIFKAKRNIKNIK